LLKGGEGKKSLDSERKRFTWEKESGSRLFAVDAGNDAVELRKRYPDRKKYLITPAKVRLRLLSANKMMKKPVLSGYVDEILTDTIHVPCDRQGVLASLKPNEHDLYYDGRKESYVSRYTVTLNYGRRYEPWVAEVVAK
jgi:hypothetical protein